jgi:hypothetical protein
VRSPRVPGHHAGVLGTSVGDVGAVVYCCRWSAFVRSGNGHCLDHNVEVNFQLARPGAPGRQPGQKRSFPTCGLPSLVRSVAGAHLWLRAWEKGRESRARDLYLDWWDTVTNLLEPMGLMLHSA